MRRNRKAFHDAMATINADTVVFPTWGRIGYWVAEAVELGMQVAHAGVHTLRNARVRWQLGDGENGGELPLPELAPGASVPVGAIAFKASEVETAQIEEVRVTLEVEDEQQVASNSLPLAFFPRRDAGRFAAIRLWVAQPGLRQGLAALGYQIAPNPAAADGIVVDELHYAHADYLRQGGRLLLLAQREGTMIGDFLGLRVRARRHTEWSGNWASSFAWLRRDGPFARFPGGPLLDYSFGAAMPEHVIVGLGSGLGPWDFENNVFAGIFVGWIHKVIMKRQYGAGSAVLSTFRINPLFLGPDPVTTLLLDSLIELMLLN
jgi:hypothetical protein